jgi:FlaA1/EpsC-like NDP-sugar epimerase
MLGGLKAMPVSPRTALVILHDLLACVLAWMGGYWLRFNLAIPEEYSHAALTNLMWVAPLQAVIFWRFGLYQGIWRFASLPDLKRILQAVGVAAVATPVVLILFRVEAIVPRTVMLLDPILLLLIVGGSRLAYRAWRERRLTNLDISAKPVLVVGAGLAADNLLRELQRNPRNWHVVGLLDDGQGSQGRQIQGVPVVGGIADLAVWVEQKGVDDVILALPSASPLVRRQVNEICAHAGVRLLTVPSLDDIMHGRVAVSALRSIELEDLLGRSPVSLDDAGLGAFLGGAAVLVTGAGGSIGAELCRQIARYRPSRLVMLELNEYALYRMEQEFAAAFPDLPLACVIGDVKDAGRMDELMAAYRPRVVFHAAAYKHVPLMEQGNAFEAMRNNVIGTQVCGEAAIAHGVEKFVLVSTDKAVNPTNVMGASKRMAEMVCQWLQGRDGNRVGTRFIAVRFGNVLGSSGSVVPKFQAQIAAGGPLTVTHPDITRFFMTIPEAAQLVLQAGLMGEGGELYVLDMGDPVRIADLARLMVRLVGKTEAEIGIVYTGLRPGEKLYEELLADSETTLPTPHPKLRVARSRPVDVAPLLVSLEWMQSHVKANRREVLDHLCDCVPEYRPSEGTDPLK